jgi:hypothetical protein
VVYPERELVVKGARLNRRQLLLALDDLSHPVELMPEVLLNKDANMAVLRFEEEGDVPSLMRERFTSLDLGWATGVLPDQAEAIVDALLIT